MEETINKKLNNFDFFSESPKKDLKDEHPHSRKSSTSSSTDEEDSPEVKEVLRQENQMLTAKENKDNSSVCENIAYYLMDKIKANKKLGNYSERFKAQKSDEFTAKRQLCITIGDYMHRLKLLEDKFYTNKYYAKVGALTVTSLNQYEMRIFSEFDFKPTISQIEFNDYIKYKFKF